MNRVGCVLIFRTSGAGAQHMWCGCLAHVRRINTIAVYGRVGI